MSSIPHLSTIQPKPTKGRMRIHCLENVDKALQFLKEQRVHLENMGSHDIVDGNHRLILGLIWTIILRFQVSPSFWLINIALAIKHTEQSKRSDIYSRPTAELCLMLMEKAYIIWLIGKAYIYF